MSSAPSAAPTMDNDTLVPWTGIWVTLLVSVAQGIVCYTVFLRQRAKDRTRWLENNPHHSNCADPEAAKRVYDIYESRQHTRSYRSPPPFGMESTTASAMRPTHSNHSSMSGDASDGDHHNTGAAAAAAATHKPHAWWRAAWNVSEAETLRCVGLDAYMFLRVLRVGARITGLGSLWSLILMPVYATGTVTGRRGTEQFNLVTLVRVDEPSRDTWRLYVTVACWYVYGAFALYEFYTEWKRYAHHRAIYVARGDLDTPVTARYAVRVEQVALHDNTDAQLMTYFERLFPNKVFQATSVVVTDRLEQLIAQRQATILKLEAVVAKQEANRLKRGNGRSGSSTTSEITLTAQRGQPKVSAVRHYESELSRLNRLIDQVRREILTSMGSNSRNNRATTPTPKADGSIEVNMPTASNSAGLADSTSLAQRTTTAFVTFTSLRAKQAALQCALTDNPDKMVVFPAFDPASTVWNNANVPLPRQTYLATLANAFFTVGILFWAVPVSFVLLFSNLNTLLDQAFGTTVDETQAWYGLVAGLLPVILLAVLMMVLYMVITMAATKFIRYKSWPEVDSYCLFWHMLFQFANLWLIVIGGSLISGIEEITVESMADKMPGQAVFFINMILVSSFGAFGLELSMIPKTAVTWILGLVRPPAARTQRQLDSGQKPPSIVWGQVLPPVVFIYLVSFVYMSIVPVVEVFSFAYFFGMYMVWKHQCLHVYAQEFEGGGDATWQKVFVFLMACLYIGQVLFIGFMGLKKAPIHVGLGVVPLIVTVLFHRHLVRTVIVPLRYLSLEVAADVDLQDGELNTSASANTTLFRQPALDADQDERGPLPYRRKLETTMGTSV